jgi:hypothetical protein
MLLPMLYVLIMALIDLTGQKFGKLLVVGYRVTINGRPYWPCKCDCGNICSRLSDRLLSGQCNSCGCEKGRPRKYKIGDRIGKVIIQEISYKYPGKKKYLLYKCLCDCGKNVIVHNLSPSQSCGCSWLKKKSKPNSFRVEGAVAWFKVSNGVEFCIDSEDTPKIEKYHWNLSEGYICTTVTGGKRIRLHNLIMEKKEGLLIDHKDRNTLNNRKENLRYATSTENIWNAFSHHKKTKGVSYHKPSKKWWARITAHRKVYSLGLYKEIEDAIRAYDEACIRLHPTFALTNSSNAHNLNTQESDDKLPDNPSGVQEPLSLPYPKNDTEKPSEYFSDRG